MYSAVGHQLQGRGMVPAERVRVVFHFLSSMC
jgi:hypothetical protein